MAKYLPVTISSATGPGNLLTVFPQDLGPQGTGKEETGESAAARTAGPAAAPPSSLLKLERVRQAGGGAVGWRRTWTAWRAVGSTVPVKGNSTMTTRYKVPNFSMLDCHKHGGCLWDVIRPGCPKHTKHQKVSPPPQTRDWRCGGGGFPSRLHRQHAQVLTALAPPPLHWRVRCLEKAT